MPTLKEKVDADLKDAMRSKNELTTSVLRMLKSAIKYKEVEPGGKPLDDKGVHQVISTLIKQRRDSIEQFQAAGRTDLVEKESAELELLKQYLPQPLSDPELAAAIEAAIAEAGAGGGPQAMGKVMGLLKARLAGKADMGRVSSLVKARLNP